MVGAPRTLQGWCPWMGWWGWSRGWELRAAGVPRTRHRYTHAISGPTSDPSVFRGYLRCSFVPALPLRRTAMTHAGRVCAGTLLPSGCFTVLVVTNWGLKLRRETRLDIYSAGYFFNPVHSCCHRWLALWARNSTRRDVESGKNRGESDAEFKHFMTFSFEFVIGCVRFQYDYYITRVVISRSRFFWRE